MDYQQYLPGAVVFTVGATALYFAMHKEARKRFSLALEHFASSRELYKGTFVSLSYIILISGGLFLAGQLWAMVAVSGILGGLLGALIGFPFIPHAVERFSNKPNRWAHTVSEEDREAGKYEGSDFGFFTFLSPGQFKIIERGGRFIRGVMRYDNHSLRGEISFKDGRRRFEQKEQEYWEVKKTPTGRLDSHPVPYQGWSSLFNPLFWWARHVYNVTGGVFTGLWPFQKVRIYKMTRIEAIQQADDSYIFNSKTDWSDHYRVAESQLFVEIPNADTKDKIAVDVKWMLTVEHTNPYLTAYQTDNWALRFDASTTDATNRFTRAREFDDVLTAELGKEGEFAQFVVGQLDQKQKRSPGGKTGERFGTPVASKIGMKVTEGALLSVATTDPKYREALARERTSRSEQIAIENVGKGRAAANQAIIDVAKSHGKLGELVIEQETQIRTAEAMGQNGTVILDGGSKRTVNPGIAFLRDSIEGKE